MERDDILKRMLGDKRATRRDFLVGATALGLSATAASSMWSKAARAAPTKGGHMKAALGGGATTDSLNPATYNDTYMISVSFSIRDNLTEIAPDNSLRGGAAESWEASDDAATWTFNLRKGVEFSNGKSLEAQDVINSINMHRGEGSGSGATGVVAGIEEITADGKNRVIFKLKSGDADFPYILTDYHLNILPAKDDGVDWESGIGTGAYLLEKYEPGIRADLKINPNRWQQDTGFVDSVEMIGVNDGNARQNAVMTGQMHVMNKVDLKTVHLMKRNPNVKILDVPGRLHHTLPMDTRVEPFGNNDVRLALKYAIDRKEYLQKILKGYGTLGNDNPIGPAFRYFAPDIPQREYDPDKARFHMKKSGLDSLQVDLSSAAGIFPGAVDAAVLYKEQARKAGIDINVVREPNDGYWANIWMTKPWCMCWWGPRPTEDLILSIAYLGGASWNDTRIQIDRLDELIIAARAELDDKKRSELYAEAQLIIRDEGATVVPVFANMVAAVNKDVGVSEHIGGSWEMDGGHWPKRWWLT